jgi:hypothetical protein
MQIGRGGIGEPRGHCADAPPHPEPGDPDIDKLTAYIGYARTYTGRSGSLDLPSVMNQRTNTLGLRWDITRHIPNAMESEVALRSGDQRFPCRDQASTHRLNIGATTLQLIVGVRK